MSGIATAEHYDAQPSHVSLTYDKPTLEKYRPELVFREEAREKFIGLYGWVATSPEYDTGICVYWASYTHQDGVSPFWGMLSDSHLGDHEPIQVEWDRDTGEVKCVRASIYHWTKGEVPGHEAAMNGTNPHLEVVSPWHQYTAATRSGVLPEVKDLTEHFEGWLDNGLEEPLEPGTSTNPWSMATRSHWWRTKRGWSFDAFIVNMMMGIRGDEIGSLDEN